MAIKQLETAGDKKALQKLVGDAQKKFEKVEKALAELKLTTSQMPAAFKQLHPGNVNNLDTPKEYRIAVSVENFKDMYSVSKEMRNSKKELDALEQELKAYK